MRFINKSESIKIRIGNLKEFKWITLKKGESIELSREVGIANGLEEIKITESQISQTKVETKQFYTPDDEFFKQLTKIKGVGKKTANDIVVWGTREKLVEQIQLNTELPFGDDIVEKLKRHYGQIM